MGKFMSYIRTLILGLATTFGLFACHDANPVKPVNHNPVIQSLTVFPEVVGPLDSLVAFCDASDPDGDSLVYDWYTNPVIMIKGAQNPSYLLSNMRENFAVFYTPDPRLMTGPVDTAYVECAVRDGKGGQAVKDVIFLVEKDSSNRK
jgi:hypothetical protein